jgi:alpha-1,3-glucosyltransferase
LPLALATTAWGFFLFSFQVHEKSVLLPLMPMTVLLAGNQGLGKRVRAWVGFANLLGVWTMFPLLQRVDLRIPYYVLSLLWAYLLGLPPASFDAYKQDGDSSWAELATRSVHYVFYAFMAIWHVVESFLSPPYDKPDLWVVINAGVGAAGFAICYLWCLWSLATESGLIDFSKSEKKKAKSQ